MRRLSSDCSAALGTLVLGGTLLVSGGARAQSCRPAEVDPAMAEPPTAWQNALQELLDASAQSDQPWGCPNSRVSLALPASHTYALLSVEARDGRRAARRVATPADLVPVGKALLAQVEPLAESVAEPAPAVPQSYLPEPTVPAASPSAPVADASAPNEDAEPRAYFDGQGSVRYAGGTDGLMVGGSLRATLPLDPWMLGLWGRYEALAHPFTEPTAEECFMGALAVGLVGGYRLVDAPVRLDVGLTGSLVVINMSGEGQFGELDEVEPDAGTADGRIGSELRLGIPLSRRWHGLATLDAELAPGALGSEQSRRIHELLPLVPAYMLGLSVGVEGALR